MYNIGLLQNIIQKLDAGDIIPDDRIEMIEDFIDINRNLLCDMNEYKLIQKLELLLEKKLVTDDLKERIEENISKIDNLDSEVDYLNYLVSKVHRGENIGIDLIKILRDQSLVDFINNSAESELHDALYSYYVNDVQNPEIVFLSLSLIGLLYYDGNFYDKVEQVYENLYLKFSKQRIESLIRAVLYDYFDSNVSRTRLINVVLENAIVPYHYLPAFFDFIYDIYAKNFEYMLSDDLQSDFAFVYEGLSIDINADVDDLKIGVTKKTYRLIKTTKALIGDYSQHDNLIKLSIMIIRLIDKFYWDKNVKILNPYLKYGYETWLKSNDVVIPKKNGTRPAFISIFKPELQLINEKVYLVPPSHKIQAHDYSKVKVIVLNGESVIKEINSPNIRAIIGGFQVKIDPIELSNPLGALKYLILEGDRIVYDSKDTLNRNIIVFNGEGKEVSNKTDYEGDVKICCNTNINNLEAYLSTLNYKLYYKHVAIGDILIYGDNIFSFSHTIKPGIIGNDYERTYIFDDSDRRFPVYKTVNEIIFEDYELNDNYEILINGKRKRITEYEYKVSNHNVKYLYDVFIDISELGIYDLSVKLLKDGREIKRCEFNFAVDPNLLVDKIQVDGNYLVDIDSGFTNYYKEVTLESFQLDDVKFTYNGKNYTYYIPVPMDIYRLDKSEWHPYDKYIWIKEVHDDSYIDVFDTNISDCIIYDSSGKEICNELKITHIDNFTRIKIGTLISIVDSDMIWIGLLANGKLVNRIDCYYHCVIDTKKTKLKFDPIKEILSIYTEYCGDANLDLVIKSPQSSYVENNVKNKATSYIKGFRSFSNYTLEYVEKTSLFGKTIYSKDFKVYAYSKFINKSFKITKAYYEQCMGNTIKECGYSIDNTYITFNTQKAENKFRGALFKIIGNRKYYYRYLGVIDIEMCGLTTDSKLEVYLSKDGDGLLLDDKNHTILDTDFDKKASDIYSCIVDLDGDSNG